MRALTPKLLTEFAGTFVFLTVIGLSAAAGALAPLAIGLALMAMVYMGGHVSGAHFNPAVSFGLWLRRAIPASTMGLYWLAQLVAGVLAFVLAHLVAGKTGGIQPGPDVSVISATAVEILFTAALVLVVLNVAATKETAGNSYYGLAIGMTVTSGAFLAGPISGAAFNPAVAIAATFAGSMFGHGSWSSLPIYIVGPGAGAALAALVHWLQQRPGPIAPATAERT